MRESKVSLRDVSAVHVETYQAAIDVCDRPVSKKIYDAKFSLQHCAAAALSAEIMDFSVFDKKARSEFSALAEKVELNLSDSAESVYPAHWGCDVRIEFSDGQVISAKRLDALGDPELALDNEKMIAKARKLMLHGGLVQPDGLINAILQLSENGPLPHLQFQSLTRKFS